MVIFCVLSIGICLVNVIDCGTTFWARSRRRIALVSLRINIFHAVSSYDPGMKYIQAIQRNSGVKMITVKVGTFCFIISCAGELY